MCVCVCVCVCVASGYAHKLNIVTVLDCHVHLYFGVWPVVMEDDVIKINVNRSIAATCLLISRRGNGLGT